jgi:hypothetical protein
MEHIDVSLPDVSLSPPRAPFPTLTHDASLRARRGAAGHHCGRSDENTGHRAEEEKRKVRLPVLTRLEC